MILDIEAQNTAVKTAYSTRACFICDKPERGSETVVYFVDEARMWLCPDCKKKLKTIIYKEEGSK